MTFARLVRLVVAGFACLLLAAHYLRPGNIPATVAWIAISIAVFVPVRPVRIATRVALAAGTLVWIHTAYRLASARAAVGESSTRMLVILGAVAALTAAAAWWLPGVEPKGRGGPPGDGPAVRR